jgi:hypothetical protein
MTHLDDSPRTLASTDFPGTVSGVAPTLAQVADYSNPRSEIGVGALMPYNGSLYVENYVSHKTDGTGTSLRRIDEDFSMRKVPEALGVDGTYTNRMVHYETGRLIIGPHVIDPDHTVHTVDALAGHRLCGSARHLTSPTTHVYVLTMEGLVFSLDMRDLQVTEDWDLNRELGTDGEFKVHYKDCFTAHGRFVVCSNEYGEDDWAGRQSRGRLAEFDGNAWSVIERKPFTAIGGRGDFTDTIVATGWDQASAILEVFTARDGQWTRYRLPKASHTFDHKWQTEWPRIRETEHERLLVDHHGMFYELSPWAYGGRIWGLRPVSTHLWVLGDFCSWRGLLVMGADNASPSHGKNVTTAEAQSGLWFGKTDDLWSFGKPSGWGGPWWRQEVRADEPSDPYLMTGFDQKCLHLENHGDHPATIQVQVDVHGDGHFATAVSLVVEPGALATHVFPSGFSAHWVRVVSGVDTTASAQFFYT